MAHKRIPKAQLQKIVLFYHKRLPIAELQT